ncbi:hypothetical protein [Sphingomonas sp. CFBP 13706]|uniref:hypothetical protein n=1 Tax=Sphingomonas sp. CFBP 13706 TaxID=2775314 RepID=UPI0017841466|nr:hypothetical protein [Sphingomonas sp. CFBP 13706]MBD8737865.1 hypothetical protein [Sphingomonas sp. CFBP 13706]
MAGKRDDMGRLIDPAEAQEEALRGLWDLLDEIELAGFPSELHQELFAVRNKMVADFKSRFPGQGEGRAIW